MKIFVFGGPQTLIAGSPEEADRLGKALSDQGYFVRYRCRDRRIESMEELYQLRADGDE